jgi:ABC-type antimicrobial peptide transport system permease subunit
VILWALLGFVIPIMWVAPMLLINPKMRETVREQMTRFIDGLESAG